LIEAHLMRLRRLFPLNEAEEGVLRGLPSDSRRIPARRTLVHEHDLLDHSLLLTRGWLGRAKDAGSGKRQLTEVHLPGDFADLHSFTLKRLDHKIVTLSDVTVARVPHARLEELTADHPRLARIYWFLTNVDAAVHRQWAFLLGSVSARQRLAHLLCEFHTRLDVVGLSRNGIYDFPLTQDDLATCLGLTPVHVNRTLQEIRKTGFVEIRDRQVRIHDWPALAKLADFNPEYLYQQPSVL